jgi:hypothetical protein
MLASRAPDFAGLKTLKKSSYGDARGPSVFGLRLVGHGKDLLALDILLLKCGTQRFSCSFLTQNNPSL